MIFRHSCTVTVKDSSASWPVKQGRSTFLAVSLKESCSALLVDPFSAKIFAQVLSHVKTDRVSAECFKF